MQQKSSYFKTWSCKREKVVIKVGVNIMGEICPRSHPDIAHMRYYLGPQCTTGYEIQDNLNFPMLNPHWQLCKYGPHLCVIMIAGCCANMSTQRKFHCHERNYSFTRISLNHFCCGEGMCSDILTLPSGKCIFVIVQTSLHHILT